MGGGGSEGGVYGIWREWVKKEGREEEGGVCGMRRNWLEIWKFLRKCWEN